MTNPTLLVYILGSGHNGSTLLDMILNGNSRVFSLGEISMLSQYRKGKGKEFLSNPFWQDVDNLLKVNYKKSLFEVNLGHPSSWAEMDKWDKKSADRFALENKSLFSCVAEKSGKDILVDNSKNAKRLYLLNKTGAFKVKVIHVLRDGRGVLNSFIRLYGERGSRMGIYYWKMRNLDAKRIRRFFNEKDWLQIKYEDFCKSPESSVKKICIFIGAKYEFAMLDYKKHPYFGICRNKNILSGPEKIVLDEKWKQELSWLNKAKFMLLHSWLNKYYGY